MIYAVILNSLAIIVMAIVLFNEISTNKSHWKATTHELEQVWESINILENEDPATVGEQKFCRVPEEDYELIRGKK